MNIFRKLLRHVKASQLVEKILVAAFSVSVGGAVIVYGANVVKASTSPSIDQDDISGRLYGYNQLLTNGDFSSGTSGWTCAEGSAQVVEGKMRQTVAASKRYGNLRQPMTYEAGHKYLLRVKNINPSGIQLAEGDKYQIVIYYDGWTAHFINRWQNRTDVNQTLDIDLIFGTSQTFVNEIVGTSYFALSFNFKDTATHGYWEVDSMQLFDLTYLYGAGDEPTSLSTFQQKFPNAYYPTQLTPVEMTREEINNL